MCVCGGGGRSNMFLRVPLSYASHSQQILLNRSSGLRDSITNKRMDRWTDKGGTFDKAWG